MRSPSLRRVLAALLLGGGAATGAGCGSDVVGPDLAFAIVKNNNCGDATDVQGGGRLPNVRMRVTVRVHGSDGATLPDGLCDAVADETAPALEFHTPAGTRFNLFAEAFSKTDSTRLYSGALLDVAPVAGKKLPTLFLYDAQSSTCLPQLRLGQPRAFHTATSLPNGQVLIVGGVTPLQTATEGPASGEHYFLTASVEVYDPATRSLLTLADAGGAVRAFHHAALLAPSGNAAGPFRVLLSGGYTTDSKDLPSLTSNGQSDSTELSRQGALRITPLDTAKVRSAGLEILTYDPAARTVKRDPAPSLMLHSLAGAGGAALPGGGVVEAGGYATLGATLTPDTHLDVTADGATATGAMLPEGRVAPGVIVYPDGQRGMIVGGIIDSNGGKELLRLSGIGGAMLSAKPVDATSTAPLPLLQAPTLTLIDSSAGASRFLISGALEGGFTSLFPAGIGPQIVTDAATGAVTVTPAKLDAVPLACDKMGAHYHPVAWDAATRLAHGDRILLSGGTARNDNPASCTGCEGGETSFACAVHQLLLFDVATGTVAPASADGLRQSRFGHTQSLLPDGTVLIAGGLRSTAAGVTAPAQLELYNPARKVATKSMQGGVTVDADDPVLPDLLRLKWTRDAGQPLVDAASGQKHACAVPQP